MAHFDVRTAYIIIGLLYLLLPSVTWGVMAAHRTVAVNYWCAGSFLTGCAFLAMGMRGVAPNWVTHPVANLLLMAGVLLHAQSLRIELKPGWSAKFMLTATLTFFTVYTAIYYAAPTVSWRLKGVYLLYLTLSILLFGLTEDAKKISVAEDSRGARWIAYIYLAVLVTMTIHQFAIIAGLTTKEAINSPLTIQIFVLTIVLAAIVGHLGYMGLALDRSKRREIAVAAARASEEVSRRLGEQIAHLDRQRSMGTMAITMGHELSQPLAAAMTNTQVAMRGLQTGRFTSVQALEFLDKILHNVQRGKHIIDRIRSYARPASSECLPVDLAEVVQEAAALVTDEARSFGVGIALTPVTQGVRILGEKIQVSQVVVNIVRNAVQALKDQEAGLRHIQVAVLSQAGRAIVKIIDNGPGVPAEVLAQAGTPFFTTKPDGLGMGLAISRGITEQFGGLLSITPVPQGGTLVTLDFPALRDA